MTDEDFEKQLKEDFKNIINAMQSKSGEDIVGCPVCSGRTTYAKFRQFHAIASESGRFVGNIEERQRIEKLIDGKLNSYWFGIHDKTDSKWNKPQVLNLISSIRRKLLKEISQKEKGDEK